jgi:glycosyltransferase involved in cell wall biosynthesis
MTLLPVDATASRTSTVIPHLLRVLFRGAPPPTDLVAQAGSAFQDVPFDVVHVFRLAMLPFARPYVGASGRRLRRHLDLDDVESITRRRLAELYRSNGDDVLACFEEAAAARAEALEAEVLRDFDRIYVCSEVDKQALAARSNTPVCVLPNALPVSAPLPRPGRTGGPFTFLFVGTLGYYPNEEGIVHFCAEVLPLLRRTAPRDFQVIIVGSGATPAVQQLAGRPEVRLVGAVPDVAPWYAEADAVVVPIRAGGGTRIKVLEAFSYRRPVVSTSIGIEGIGAHDGKHVLVGDTPAAFSEQCMRLMTDPSLSERLTDRAFSLFMRAYTTDAVARSLAACAEPRPRPG